MLSIHFETFSFDLVQFYLSLICFMVSYWWTITAIDNVLQWISQTIWSVILDLIPLKAKGC